MLQAVLLLLLHCSYSEIINCNSSHQCYNDTIACTSNEDCTIHCNGDFSCYQTQIRAESSLSLTIISNGHNVLSSASIYCPLHSHTNTCNITYIGSGNGLNDINIYNANDFNTISITCKSINNCWSNTHKPTLHYGDAYSKTCTISDTNICEPNDILIANDNHLTPTTTFTQSISTTSTLTNDDTDNILIKDTSATYKNNVNNALTFIFIGIVCGIFVSICCCLIIFCFRTIPHKSTKLRIQTPKKLSPSLKKLSPELTPAMVELPNVDFMSKNTTMLTLPDKTPTGEGIVVTVERYANDTNQCDEEQIYSQSQNIFGLEFVKSFSSTMPDEFVVCGDDEENINYNTPC